MRRDEADILRRRLEQRLTRYFVEARETKSTEADQVFARIIAEGVSRAARELPNIEHPRVREAEGNFVRILEAAQAVRREQGGTVVTSFVVEAALRGLCPIWPFC